MGTSDIWQSMGFIDRVDTDEHKDKLTEDFNELCYRIEDGDEIDYLIDEIGLERWWNSFLPKNYDEWVSFIDSDDDEVIDEVKELCEFDNVAGSSVFFGVLTEMEKKYPDLDFDYFIDALIMVTMDPLKNTTPSNYKNIYGTLHENAVEIITKQCSVFYEMLTILKEVY